VHTPALPPVDAQVKFSGRPAETKVSRGLFGPNLPVRACDPPKPPGAI